MTQQRLPHHHHPVTYSKPGSVTENSFQAMLCVWYKVADILRTLPAGTLIRYPQGYLFMCELNGELFMFESMDVDPGAESSDFNSFRPDDFEGIDEHEFDQIKVDLEKVLASELVTASIASQVAADAISGRYTLDHSSVANWIWDGVDHTAAIKAASAGAGSADD